MTDSPGLLGAARVRELLARHDVRPDKSLGQNFVIDPNTIRKVVHVAGPRANDTVLEIGPGAGSLTVALAATAGSVVAVERDRRLLPVLREALAGADNVQIVHADALAIDLGAWKAHSLVANLPYNIAATVVLNVLEQAPSVIRLTVMAQREVGERLAAAPGSKLYGATSVITAFFAEARLAGTISRSAFWPVPNVDSVLVRVERRAEPAGVARETFARVVKTAFAQRRKTLRNTVGDLVGGGAAAEEILTASGVDPSARPETLDVEAFVELTRRVAAADPSAP